MANGPGSDVAELRFAADERPPRAVSAVIGVQTALLVCVPVVVVTTIVTRVANQSDQYLSWAVFASMVIGGFLTIVQAKRFAGLGGGTLTVMGASGVSIGVGVLALVAGGPALLGVLVLAAGLCQLALAARLALLRRIITPVVSGTLTALVAVTIMPLAFAMLTRVPESAPPAAAPTIAAVTLLCVVGLLLRGKRFVRAWNAPIGIAAGCVTAAMFGILDFERVAAARWIGIPSPTLSGLDLSFDASFWLLLPGFLFVSFVITIRQVSDNVRMQHLSRREPRAVDFRRVQGSVAACGAGTLLSGFAGVLPPWPYVAGIALASGTGVAARSIGVVIGTAFIGLAFMPKLTAVILSIPAPVLGAYIMVVFGLIFVQGMRILFQEGIDRQYSLIAGLAFWIGAGIQFQAIFPAYLATPMGRMLANGLTVGGLSILLLNLFLDVTGPRRHRVEIALRAENLAELDRFLRDFAARYKWSGKATDRLRAAAEEALLSLLREEEDGDAAAAEERRLRVVARNLRFGAGLEFTAATHEGNLENQMALLGDRPDPTSERDLSLALLRHHASSVKHHQYHNADVLTVHVNRAWTAGRS
ncbi:solute carrier family 23 protein [Candidatus Palauibacter sp.]|uniref:solute carrier family 23 protein n=1 Tax=Candidatus Palauibacter sp. TaxID=3101350 RepID=UPI003B02D9C7